MHDLPADGEKKKKKKKKKCKFKPSENTIKNYENMKTSIEVKENTCIKQKDGPSCTRIGAVTF